PSVELVQGWIDRALELSPDDSPLRAKALFARAYWNEDAEAARAAHELAERLGDVELRAHTLQALANSRWDVADYDGAAALMEQRIRLLPEITDPDHRANAYWMAVNIYLGAGRFADADRALALLAKES